MSVTAIDKQINNYLHQLNTKQKKALLTVAKTFVEEGDENWNDDEYLKEMRRRFKEMETGKVKTYTLEEVEENARKSYTAKRSKQ
ncbi:MAG TPA: hypothetical protein PL045_00750 [Chitinophagaceae bacterium]|nr:hypothetical protein [Chitinophagaceae bacterium]